MIMDFLSLRFIKRRPANGVSAPHQTRARNLTKWSLYTSAKDCLLHAFIYAYVSGDKTSLILSGEPTPEALNDAYLTIHSEYCQLVGGVQVDALIKRATAINTLSSRIERLQTLIGIAQTMVHDEVCHELTAEGYKVDHTAPNDIYMKQVATANSRLKAERMKLEALIAEQPKAAKKTEKPTEMEFTQNLIQISKHVRFQVTKNITVEEYGLYIQDLKKSIEALTPPKNGSRRAVK